MFSLLLFPSGDKGLLQHPLIEASVDVQWHRLRWLLFAEIVFHLLFVTIFSLFLVLGHGLHPSFQPIFEFTPVLMLVLTIFFYLPLLAKQLLLPLYTDKTLMPRHRFVLHLLLLFLIILVVTTRPYNPDVSYPEVVNQIHTHLSAWAILLGWTTLFLRLGDLPHLTLHLHIFLTVLRKSLVFLATLAALLVGFALAFHILLQKNALGSKRFAAAHSKQAKSRRRFLTRGNLAPNWILSGWWVTCLIEFQKRCQMTPNRVFHCWAFHFKIKCCKCSDGCRIS